MPSTVGDPLPRPARLKLAIGSRALRTGDRLIFAVQNSIRPRPYRRSRKLHIDSTLSREYAGRRKIRLDVWEPPAGRHAMSRAGADVGGKRGRGGATMQSANKGTGDGEDVGAKEKAAGGATGGRPCVIDVHGGGFTVGKGRDDARWASFLVDRLGCVVVTVSHRRGPGHPFPTAVEDVADAVLYVAAHAGELAIDPARIVLSGFSSGATCVLGAYLLMHHPSLWGYTLPYPAPTPDIAGLVPWYPLLDNTVSVDARRNSCVRPDKTLPPATIAAFFRAYVRAPVDAADLRLSPGCATDAQLRTFPPTQLQLCEYDMFNAEGLDFAHRLADLGVPTRVRTAADSLHGWDKPVPFHQYENVETEYAAAADFIRDVFDGAVEGKGLRMDDAKSRELDARWRQIKQVRDEAGEDAAGLAEPPPNEGA